MNIGICADCGEEAEVMRCKDELLRCLGCATATGHLQARSWLETTQCVIIAGVDGYVLLGDGDERIAGPFVTAAEAIADADALGLTIDNWDEVEQWQRPSEDWGK